VELTEQDKRLIGALRDGLPLAPDPYRLLGEQVGLTETEVLHRLRAYTEAGLISRFGIIVRHAPLGWRANAMVVWDVPDADMPAIAPRFAALPWVNLCYRRPAVLILAGSRIKVAVEVRLRRPW
jgi:DNA-binding Lrp family transcriptional regulator